MTAARLSPIAAALALVLAACGGGGGDGGSEGASGPTRIIDVDMVDIGFQPQELRVERGERVTFRFTNKGEVDHDAFVGDAHAQSDHADEMNDGGGHHGQGDDDAVTVEPGESERLTYTFEEAGSIEIGCHQPGHYEAGMKVDITVT